MTSTPVAFFIFNRPQTTERVFKQIKKAEPPELFVIADGPRQAVESDTQYCAEARDIIQVDWDCDVHRNYADENLGLQDRILSGLDWVFDSAEKSIILEDDCLPNQDFFRFCEEILDVYENDDRVMNVTGTNYLETWNAENQDYHFSVHGGIWGWGTWKSSWERYSSEMQLWEEKEVQDRVRDVIADDEQFYYRKKLYDKTYSGEIDSWDYQWSFARLINSGLSVVPCKNTVTNIGFGNSATNTDESNAERALIPRHNLSFPIDKKEYVAPDRSYDKERYKLDKSPLERLFYKFMSKLYRL